MLDAALEGAQLPLFEELSIAVLEVLEKGLGLKPWVELELGLDLGPDVGERVLARAPGMGLADLRGQFAESSVLAGGLLVHTGLVGGCSERRFLLHLFEEATYLLVGNHPGWGLAEEGSAKQRRRVTFWVSQPGILIVVGREL